MPKKEKTIKAIVALCEGKTDVAFLRRLLESDNYRDYKEVVAKMPPPLGLKNEKKDSYFSRKLKEYDYDSSNLRDRPILPIILRRCQGNSDVFLLLYDMNGMDRVVNYTQIITDYKNLSSQTNADSDYESSLAKIDLALAFIYDLDDKSKSERLLYIQDTYGELIDELQYLTSAKNITDSSNFKGIGYYFLADEQGQGNLESILLPLIQKDKEHVFKKAKEFLNVDGGFIRKRKGSSDKDENKTLSDFNKSLIGSVGQIEYSGMGNEDVIKLTSLLNKDKFKSSAECQAIIQFFTQLRRKL